MRAPKKTFARARRLRGEMSLPEVLLWRVLRGSRVGDLRFRRQHPVGPYILDFYCASHRLAVEVDGAGHDFGQRAFHDERRGAWLSRQGVRIVRLRAADVLDEANLDNVVGAILVAAGAPSVGFADSSPVNGGASGEAAGPPLRSGGGGPPKAVEGAPDGLRNSQSATKELTP
ncbi:MAG: endonuclease domain-containing protein [Rhizobiales bacterium]|nr:endonuclease domain-containing protein [Hyphomicrobiales bacterium]